MYKLKYFYKGKSICADDLKSDNKLIDIINLQEISSVSNIKKYHLPFSGDYVGNYSVVSMKNDNTYFIDEEEFNNLTKKFNYE